MEYQDVQNIDDMGIDLMGMFEVFLPLLALAVLGFLGGLLWRNQKKVFIWFKRLRLRFWPIDLNLALSLDFREGLNSGNYFDAIKANFLKEIDGYGLSKHILIRDFSDIRQFKTKEDAMKFRQEKEIDLIIWGGFTNDVLKQNGEGISQLNLHFTYGHPESRDGAIGAMISTDISSRLARKSYWQIVESKSFEDVQIVSNNLFDISVYILALTLKIYGKLLKSTELFESLYKSLLSRSDAFASLVLPHLFNCYELLALEYGVNKRNFKEAKNYCLKILDIDIENSWALSNLALFQYQNGEVDDARMNVMKLQTLNPRDPVTELDVAFFAALEKKYAICYKHYNNLVKFKTINFNPQMVIEFLSEQYEDCKEPALLYGSGIVSLYFGDAQIGIQDLNRFIDLSDNNTYKRMVRNAKRLVKENALVLPTV